jgi:SnoaL-like domain
LRSRPLIVVGVVVAIAAWAFWPGGDERDVRARLYELAAAASVPYAETELARATRLATIGRGVTTDVRLDAGDGRSAVTGRDAVIGAAGRLSREGPVEFHLADLAVTVADNGATAQARATVLADRPDADQGFEGQEVEIELVRNQGVWLVSRAVAVAAVQHP